MSNGVSFLEAKRIMGKNFIGPDEVNQCFFMEHVDDKDAPNISFDIELLSKKKDTHLLVLGFDKLKNGDDLNIMNLIKVMGKDPSSFEPCFYNQDWYNNEDFVQKKMERKWFLIRKEVFEDSRAVDPVALLKNNSFPSAIECVYTFFVAWFSLNIKLWYHDFIWCKDVDHNGDRIYVGKYHDIDGVNKNGFSIHRHLSLRPCYACIDCY